MVQRRVATIQLWSSLPRMSAAMAKAKGTVSPTNPVYRSGGWLSMLASSSSGLSPRPSAGAGNWVSKGLEPKAMTARKKAETMENTISTQGMNSCMRRR